MGQYIVGIDAGGTMTKAGLFDLDGAEIACAHSRNVMEAPHPGWTERDPEVMWQAATVAVRKVIESSGVSPSDIKAVSVAGYGGGLYLMDREGHSVRHGIMSTDARTVDLITEWQSNGIAGQIEALIGQHLWPGQTFALLAWLDRNEPGVFDRTYRVSFCKDFLRAQLCGDMSTDLTDAGSAGLLDPETSTYSDVLLDLLGLAHLRDKLPELGPSDEVVGRVTAKAAALTGLEEGTPVVRGTVDMSAAALASHITKPEQMSVVAGTFSIASTLNATPRRSYVPMLQFPYPLGGYMAVEGSPTSASNLEWVVKIVLAHGQSLPDEGFADIYERLNEALARRLGKPGPALFFPFLFGGANGAQAGLLGMTAQSDFDDMAIAIFEGIVFAHKLDIDKVLSGEDSAPVELIRLTGGATRSPYWSELFADILGVPIEVPKGTEFGALGVAICAASAIGAYPSLADAVAGMTGIARRYDCNADRHDVHIAKFPLFVATTHAMAAIPAALSVTEPEACHA
ncbi:FGGY-family carbohydrate kinase [Celeribacter sp.]|uniref:FGGY-family carbohydrate kinase n=1 Tax=Celeribacter sp. TaxID=1890673 RepID=UPI003A8D312E